MKYLLLVAIAAIAACVDSKKIPTPMFMSGVSRTEAQRLEAIKDRIRREGDLNP